MTDFKINVLGETYTIEFKDREADPELLDADGYVSFYTKKIIICTLNDWEDTTRDEKAKRKRECVRHEIIHAFLYESGLAGCSNPSDAWAKNEEMIDWFARQWIKIHEACALADAYGTRVILASNNKLPY